MAATFSVMTPLIFVWPHALVFWAVFLWAYAPEFGIVQRARRDQTTSDSKSLQVIMMGGGTAFLLSFALAWVPTLQFAPPFRRVALYVGVALIFLSSLLRRHCFRMLGTSFTGDVRAHADQEIVTRGAYRYLRHPSYTAGILLSIGVGFALGTWVSVVLLTIAAILTYMYRISVEERALLAVVGEPYRQFMSTRKRIIPFLY